MLKSYLPVVYGYPLNPNFSNVSNISLLTNNVSDIWLPNLLSLGVPIDNVVRFILDSYVFNT
jgi:hypothetical protein